MICFAWAEFPQYAARCVGALVHSTHELVIVVATRPRVPIEGMDALAGCPVYWTDILDSRPLKEIVGELPQVLFLSGWGTPLFNRYRDEVRAAGGKAIAMSDNNFHFSFREIIKALRFRLFLRDRYDGYFVAGNSCAKLLRFYGVPASKIKIGMYAADDSVFHCELGDILSRPKKIIYVGQFIERKNVLRLCHAFNAANVNGDWTLDLYGSGPLREKLIQLAQRPSHQTIHIHDFLQPGELAVKYREARIFCLPSLEEHWGLVVHEAVLSGCYLLLSDEIGAADDFLGAHNGVLFDPVNVEAIRKAFSHAMALDDHSLIAAQKESVLKAREVSLASFVRAVGVLS